MLLEKSSITGDLLSAGAHLPSYGCHANEITTFRYTALRSRLNVGDFSCDCNDTGSIVLVLRDFLRELPEPLIPYEFYSRALEIVMNHLKSCTFYLFMCVLIPAVEAEATQYAQRFMNKHSQYFLLARALDDGDVLFQHLSLPDITQSTHTISRVSLNDSQWRHSR